MSTSKRPTTSRKSADFSPLPPPREIELLAPAKDKECGMEAIRHGADAVYIGAQSFSARAAAGNSLSDIAELTAFAHFYRAKVYVALNTLLTDEELPKACALAFSLARVGVDALIVQDMGLFRRLAQHAQRLPGNRFPIPLHASTQMDNRTAEKVAFLQRCGMEQIVLARELSAEEIKAIHKQCPEARLEVFVHGALCVSYSGQCYISQYLFGRSANKGCCAQACRLTYDLCDAKGATLLEKQPLLSLKDLNQSDRLGTLLEAGVSSLKIEGRLKGVEYVKNLTAFYRKKLDSYIASHADRYARASSGQVSFGFTPDPYKSFNRGFTQYFLGKSEKVPAERGKSASPFSLSAAPVSKGEPMGKIVAVQKNRISVRYSAPDVRFHNGDGALIMAKDRHIGLQINRAEGEMLFCNPKDAEGLTAKGLVGAPIFRNRDSQFERLLSRPTATRRIRIRMSLRETAFGFSLELTDEDGISVTLSFADPKETARSPQQDLIRSSLGKLGNTPFVCAEDDIELCLSASWFLPSARLNEWRRAAVESLQRARMLNYHVASASCPRQFPEYPEKELSYRGNVLNREARHFYEACGVHSIEPAYEAVPAHGAVLMHTRYCIRKEWGQCRLMPRKGEKKWEDPLYLRRGNLLFPLRFDCKRCEMSVLAPDELT